MKCIFFENFREKKNATTLMMDLQWLDRVIRNMCRNLDQCVEGKSTFHAFELNENSNNVDGWKEGFNSIQIYGNMVYEDESRTVRKSSPIFIKLTAKSRYRKLSSSFQFINEMNFYSKVVPALNTLDVSFGSLFPKFFHGEMIFNPKGDQSAIVFEDLKAIGYKMSDKKSFLDYQHLILMMRKLGQFHAYSYKAKKDLPDLFYPLRNNALESNRVLNKDFFDVFAESGRRGLDSLKQNPDYKRYVPKIEELLENTTECFRRTLTGDRDNPKSVIIHGDFMRSNVMFKYEENIPTDMVLIDMAMYRYASPAIDLASILYMNADQETRIKHWDSLIDEYYAALEQTFSQNKIPTKHEILSEFVGRCFLQYLIASDFVQYIMAADDPSMLGDKEIDLQHTTRESLLEDNLTIGGEPATRALSDILKDMIDRGFICK